MNPKTPVLPPINTLPEKTKEQEHEGKRMLANTITQNALAAAAATEARSAWLRKRAEDARRKWYCLCVQPQHDGIVCGHLIGLGIKVFSPMMPADVPVYSRKMLTGERSVSGRKRVMRAMFPGYVFSRLDFEAEWPRVRTRAGVDRVHSLDHADGAPYVVPDLLITALYDKEQQLVAAKPRQRHEFQPGQQVRVYQGPFADFLGCIDRLEDGNRIRLLLDLFGRRTPVVVEAHEVEAVER
jgi:transcription antitermination factor NusG